MIHYDHHIITDLKLLSSTGLFQRETYVVDLYEKHGIKTSEKISQTLHVVVFEEEICI